MMKCIFIVHQLANKYHYNYNGVWMLPNFIVLIITNNFSYTHRLATPMIDVIQIIWLKSLTTLL